MTPLANTVVAPLLAAAFIYPVLPCSMPFSLLPQGLARCLLQELCTHPPVSTNLNMCVKTLWALCSLILAPPPHPPSHLVRASTPIFDEAIAMFPSSLFQSVSSVVSHSRSVIACIPLECFRNFPLTLRQMVRRLPRLAWIFRPCGPSHRCMQPSVVSIVAIHLPRANRICWSGAWIRKTTLLQLGF